MKTEYYIQIKRIDNGFIVAARSDEQGVRQKNLQAADEAGVKKIIHEVADTLVFTEPETKEKVAKATTQPEEPKK